MKKNTFVNMIYTFLILPGTVYIDVENVTTQNDKNVGVVRLDFSISVQALVIGSILVN